MLDHILANADRGSNDSVGSILDPVQTLLHEIGELGKVFVNCGRLTRASSDNKTRKEEGRQQHVQPLRNGPATIVAPRPTRSSTIWIHMSSGGGGTGAKVVSKAGRLSARTPDWCPIASI